MKKLIILLTWLFASSVAAAGQVDSQKKNLIEELLQQIGNSSAQVSRQFSNLFITQMEQSLKRTNPNIAPKAFRIMEEEINAVIHDELLSGNKFSEMMYPIYAKKFSTEELQQMIDFNNTPLGKKMIKVMPQITREAMLVGQAYGKKLAPQIKDRVIKRFEKEGIK